MPAKPSRSQRPRWSLRSTFLVGIGLVAILTPLVLLTVHRSIWQELEIVTGVLALVMFVYLAVVLHQGVRFDKAEGFVVDWPQGGPRDFVEWAPTEFGGFFTEAGAEGGLVGLVVGFLLDLLASLLLAVVISVVIWLGVNAAVAVILAVFLPVFYFYRRSLRYIVARGRTCRGRWGRAAAFAAAATLLYTVWFYLIFYAAECVTRLNAG